MTRWWCALIVACVAARYAAGDESKPAPPTIVPAKGLAKPLSAEILIAKLAERVDVERPWSGLLEQALEHLTAQIGIPIVLDHVSFRCADPPFENAGEVAVGIEKARHQPYRSLLERMLTRIDAVVLVREDHYEIVARQIASRAADPSYAPEESEWSGFGIGPWRPIYPTISIVHVVGEKRPLDE